MHDLRTRVGILGLILAFPLLMVAMSPRRPSARAAAVPVLAVETVLIAGLAMAGRERLRLRAARAAEFGAPIGRPLTGRPHVIRPFSRANAGRS
jgi:hypothetical protein